MLGCCLTRDVPIWESRWMRGEHVHGQTTDTWAATYRHNNREPLLQTTFHKEVAVRANKRSRRAVEAAAITGFGGSLEVACRDR